MTGADPGSVRAAGNKHRAVLLVAISAAVVGLVVAALALLVMGPLVALAGGLVVAVAFAMLVWWGSAHLALRLLGAQPADPIKQARLFNLVEGLGANAGVAPPDLFILPDAGLNALTMGRSAHHATLVVTSGLLDQLSRIELEAVLAHELSHIRNDDILTATVAVGLFGLLGRPARAAAGTGARAVLASLLLPMSALAGLGMRLSVDPHREELADRAGVHLTRYPPALVTALEKMQQSSTLVAAGCRSPATAHLWLGAPLPPPPSDRLAWLSRLYDTHPPLDERIEALREL
ncbi:MAG: M48 family metalloprotease [Actinomycetota bacterium]|nr:M48 family metalloprotease [Actinomycetota bacterium]MDQ6948702.1 M48 family metalloprotease [Actinomycetota bacterium]